MSIPRETLANIIRSVPAGIPIEEVAASMEIPADYARELRQEGSMPGKPPATEAQLRRIGSLLDHPAVEEYMNEMTKEKFAQLISTQGSAGILIALMKKKVAQYERSHGVQTS